MGRVYAAPKPSPSMHRPFKKNSYKKNFEKKMFLIKKSTKTLEKVINFVTDRQRQTETDRDRHIVFISWAGPAKSPEIALEILYFP